MKESTKHIAMRTICITITIISLIYTAYAKKKGAKLPLTTKKTTKTLSYYEEKNREEIKSTLIEKFINDQLSRKTTSIKANDDKNFTVWQDCTEYDNNSDLEDEPMNILFVEYKNCLLVYCRSKKFAKAYDPKDYADKLNNKMLGDDDLNVFKDMLKFMSKNMYYSEYDIDFKFSKKTKKKNKDINSYENENINEDEKENENINEDEKEDENENEKEDENKNENEDENKNEEQKNKNIADLVLPRVSKIIRNGDNECIVLHSLSKCGISLSKSFDDLTNFLLIND